MMIRMLIATMTLLLITQTRNEQIVWSDTYKLQWSDFVGQPDQNSVAAATTSSGITFGYSIQENDGEITGFKAHVTALFYPDKSWVKPKEATEHILAHEQLHFDITELHARKLRKQISELTLSNNIAQQIESLQLSNNKAWSETQDKYDSDSDYSRIKEQQYLWQQEIASQLKKLDNFKQPK